MDMGSNGRNVIYSSEGLDERGGCIVLVEPEQDPDFEFDSSNGLLNSNWMTTYCRLRRASQLMYVIDVTVYYNLIN